MLGTIVKGLLRRLILVVAVLNLTALALLVALPSPPLARQGVGYETADSISIAARIDFLDRRDPLVDRILPAGVGGLQVVPSLDGNDGVALTEHSRIVITAAAALDRSSAGAASRGEIVEMHERAHLLNAAHPELVAALIDVVPAPDADTYAATNSGEHLAEMFANAWEIVRSQDITNICAHYDGLVRNMEARVPGTAGMLLWMLPVWERARGVDAEPVLVADAAAAAQGYQRQWQALADAVELRRTSAGTLTPWEVPTVGVQLRRIHIELRRSDQWWERAVGWGIWPSAVIAARI